MTAYLDIPDPHSQFREYTPADITRLQRTARMREFLATQERFQDALTTYDRVAATLKANPQAKITPAQREVYDKIVEAQRALIQMRDVAGTPPHVDASLATLSIRFQNEDYIGTQIMPIAVVPKQSDKYSVYSDRDYLAYPSADIGPRGEVQQLSTNIDQSSSYFCAGKAMEERVDMDNISNADAPLDLLGNANYKANDGLEWNREKDIAGVLTTSGNYGANYNTLAAGSEWDSPGGGTPVKDIQDAVGACLGGPGPTELVGWCGFNVYKVLARHPEVRELYKYTGSGLASPQLIAGIFGLDKLLVGKAWQDTANIGQTLSLDRIWGEYFGVARVSKMPKKDNYSFGFCFDWEGKQTVVTYEQRSGRRGSYFVKVSDAWVPKVVAQRAGYLVGNCLA
jgi:hypothetical protein